MIFNNILQKDLNNNQRNLIKWLESNSDQIIKMSIADVAKQNFVSISFVTKTLKKVGFFGWKDFKGQISGRMSVSRSDNGYLKYLEDTLIKSIANTISHINEEDIVDLANIMSDSSKDIFFIGEGFSYYTALDQARKYNKSGIRAFAINSTDYQLSSIRENDIVIFISASGVTPSIQESIKYLEERNVYSTLITLNKMVKSGFAKIIYGVVYDPENFNEREFPKHSRIVLLTILDWVYTKVSKKIKVNDKKDNT